jgi:hypothetical protein
MNHFHPLSLFIIKKFHDSAGSVGPISNGLRNSAQFVVDMLLMEGKRAKLVEAIDGNSVDALIAQNQPTRVVIEALWVTPAKMAELQRLWPKVKWTVRIHSETPFLSTEGIAVEWIKAYLDQGIEVAFNSAATADDFAGVYYARNIIWLPNYYPLRKPRSLRPRGTVLDIGCFGAIRPLKNQLIQAIAAARYAMTEGKELRFHMNGTRMEQFGQSNLRNIQALLGDQLVMHPWMDHEDFLELISQMDMVLAVSLTESFAIVAADTVSIGIPLIGSDAIPWLPDRSQAPVDESIAIVVAMQQADDTTVVMNQHALKAYLREAVSLWLTWNG